jgi:hypothetical protein
MEPRMMFLDAHLPTAPLVKPSGESVRQEYGNGEMEAVVAGDDRMAKLLKRAGFDVDGRAVTEPSEPSGPSATSGRTSSTVRVAGDGLSPVLLAAWAARVHRAAESLDDPTTTLLANLDSLEEDLAHGGLRPDDVGEVLADCIGAVRQLIEGVRQVKVMAASGAVEAQ